MVGTVALSGADGGGGDGTRRPVSATIDVYLAYLNHGRHIARAHDTGSFKAFTDIRQRVTIDLGTASDAELRVLAGQLLAVATADALVVLPGALRTRLDGTADDLRTFLQTQLQSAWTTDLRIATSQTLPNAGSNVRAAAQQALEDGSIDAYLTYLNGGLYVARALDCAL